jgi:hypothetical protein
VRTKCSSAISCGPVVLLRVARLSDEKISGILLTLRDLGRPSTRKSQEGAGLYSYRRATIGSTRIARRAGT